MRPLIVVFGDPRIKIGLQLVDRAIDLFAKRHPIEFVEHSAMEALADAIGLRALGLGAAVIDVLNGKVELVFVALGAAKFGAAIGQHPRQPDAVLVVEWHHPVVEDLGGGDRRLAIIELGKGDLGIGVDHGLLIDPADTLQSTDIERILGAAITGAFALELAMRFLVGFGLLESGDLGFGQQDPVLRDLGFEGLEAVLDRRQIVALPHATHARRRDRQTLSFQRLRHPHLTPGRLLDRQVDHRLFDLRRRAVLQHWLAPADLLQRQLAAFLVKLLEAVKAIAAVAHHLAGLADPRFRRGRLLPSCLANSSKPSLARMIFCSWVMRGPSIPGGGSRSQLGVRTAPRPPAPFRKPTTNVRLSSSYYTSRTSPGARATAGAANGGSSPRRNGPAARPIRALSSPRWPARSTRPATSTRSSTAP